MNLLKVRNPFNAPVYHMETVTSTMDISRQLAAEGASHGTVITADFQEAGRGRGCDQGQGRVWEMERGVNLPFTILLQFKHIDDIPPALTLRTGFAISLAIEDFASSLKESVKVKWPNDIMIGNKKAVGILCEADGKNVHIGVGINVLQKKFPAHLQEKATSIAAAAGCEFNKDSRFILLEKTLTLLHRELIPENYAAGYSWIQRLEQRLYKIGEQVVFIDGAAGSGREVKGRITGVSENGELLIIPQGETTVRRLVTGEVVFA